MDSLSLAYLWWQYDTELFPGLIYRMKQPKMVFAYICLWKNCPNRSQGNIFAYNPPPFGSLDFFFCFYFHFLGDR